MLTKKKIVIIAGLFLVLVLILVFFGKRTPQLQSTLPQPSFPAYFPVQPQPEISFGDLNKVKQKQLAVYQLPKTDRQILIDFFNPIASDLQVKITNESTNPDYLSWGNPEKQLSVKLTTGQFTLKISPQLPNRGLSINEADALIIARNWLNKYKLIDPQTQADVSYLTSDGSELSPTTIKSEGVFFQFNFRPGLDTYPFFPNNLRDGPISVTVTNMGEIFYINYQLPVLFYAQWLINPKFLSSNNFPIKTTEQINQAITQNQAIIVFSQTENGQAQTSTAKITQVNYKTTVLGYQSQPHNNLIIPIFQLTGTGILEDGTVVTVTAYLPAMAE